MPKSPDAFRTISEVADWLGIQAHVLRFWESKFSQVKPIKRAGGRRYYRPNDMLLLGGIRQLLHEDGLTIKGVQKILREEGMSHVASLSQPLDELTQSQIDEGTSEQYDHASIDVAEPVQESGVVLNFDHRPAPEKTPEPESEPEDETAPVGAPETAAPPETTDQPIEADAEPETQPEPDDAVTSGDGDLDAQVDATPEPEPEPRIGMSIEADVPDVLEDAPADHETPEVEPLESAAAPEPEEIQQATPQSAPQPNDNAPAHDTSPATPEDGAQDAAADADAEPVAAALPAFLRRPMAEPEAPSDNAPAPVDAAEPAPPAPTPPKPRDIGMPDITPHDQIAADPAALTQVFRTRSLTTTQAKQIAPLLDKLTILRDSMAARRRNAPSPGPND